MKRVFSALIVLFLMFFGLIGLKFGNAITQEGDPIPYLKAIIRYEFTHEGFQAVVQTKNHTRYISGSKRQDSYQPVRDFMKGQGWRFKEHMGSSLVFVKDGEHINIETRQYSNDYYIWDVPKEAVGSRHN